jgi:hypothetical protein
LRLPLAAANELALRYSFAALLHCSDSITVFFVLAFWSLKNYFSIIDEPL